jgi:hypothetical protein
LLLFGNKKFNICIDIAYDIGYDIEDTIKRLVLDVRYFIDIEKKSSISGAIFNFDTSWTFDID